MIYPPKRHPRRGQTFCEDFAGGFIIGGRFWGEASALAIFADLAGAI
jgi:hypothetical protein